MKFVVNKDFGIYFEESDPTLDGILPKSYGEEVYYNNEIDRTKTVSSKVHYKVFLDILKDRKINIPTLSRLTGINSNVFYGLKYETESPYRGTISRYVARRVINVLHLTNEEIDKLFKGFTHYDF